VTDSTAPVVLVVDDEAPILRALRGVLTRAGFRAVLATTGEEALGLAAQDPPDLVVLDLALPGISGLEVCRVLHESLRAPILVLSVRDAEADKISALNLGADDYLTKPFSSGELIARLHALLRRAGGGTRQPSVVRSGDLVVDLVKKSARRGSEEVDLTRLEFRLLAVLAENADRVVTLSALAKELWGADSGDNIRALRVHISNLRSKVEESPSSPHHVLTESGIGYRLVTETAE
jgi:two-component system KDP operon response regulator KdpE